MVVEITGYFKFRRPKTARVRVPDLAVSEGLLRREAGQRVFFTKSSPRDAWNAVVGKCAELGWYRNGGWLPNGRGGGRCAVKDQGDVLGVCVRFRAFLPSPPAAWVYCDRELERAVLEDFFPPDERLAIEARGSLRGLVVGAETLPGRKWLDGFCRRTHDPEAFSRARFGRVLTKAELDRVAAERPKLKGYLEKMFGWKPG